MAGRAGGGKGQQVKSRGKQEASENGKKGGRENKRKRPRMPIPQATGARSDEGASKGHNRWCRSMEGEPKYIRVFAKRRNGGVSLLKDRVPDVLPSA